MRTGDVGGQGICKDDEGRFFAVPNVVERLIPSVYEPQQQCGSVVVVAVVRCQRCFNVCYWCTASLQSTTAAVRSNKRNADYEMRKESLVLSLSPWMCTPFNTYRVKI